jgi:hypothetical protein
MSYAYVLLTGVGCVCGREDMVRQCLHEMKACFETCLASSQALEEAMARHFQPAGGQVRPSIRFNRQPLPPSLVQRLLSCSARVVGKATCR